MHPVAPGRRLDVSSALRRDWLALQVAEAYLRLIGRVARATETRDERSTRFTLADARGRLRHCTDSFGERG